VAVPEEPARERARAPKVARRPSARERLAALLQAAELPPAFARTFRARKGRR